MSSFLVEGEVHPDSYLVTDKASFLVIFYLHHSAETEKQRKVFAIPEPFVYLCIRIKRGGPKNLYLKELFVGLSRKLKR
jgi:hypothetical protein